MVRRRRQFNRTECPHQPQSKFSLQLAYWDVFKQFDFMGARKAANLAKLLFNLIVTHQTLKLLPVIKTIDISEEDIADVMQWIKKEES